MGYYQMTQHKQIFGFSESMEREITLEGVFSEVIMEKSPNLEKERDTHVQEAHRTPNTHDLKRFSP